MNILLPTDFSDNSYKAIEYAYKHFDLEKVNLQLIHVIKEPNSTSGVLLRLDDIMKQDAERDMVKLLARIKEDFGSVPTYTINHGYLKDWVETMAKAAQVHLIIMATKGENNIKSKVMGSITESIIRTSEISVIAVPVGTTNFEMQDILFASNRIHFENSEFIKQLLHSMKQKTPRLNVLTVLNYETTSAPKSIALDEYQVPVKTENYQSAVEGINAYLASQKVDLLVLYHSHNSKLDYLFNRSITKTICAHIQVPILVMPSAG